MSFGQGRIRAVAGHGIGNLGGKGFMVAVQSLLDGERHKGDQHYIAYQQDVTRVHLIPLLQRLDIGPNGAVLDVGCGTGGCVLALASHFGIKAYGFDIDPRRITAARRAASDSGITATFEVFDVTKDPLPDARFGLILMRDVVEHLADIGTGLRRLRDCVADDCHLYVTFPPWRGPYAGHQHNAAGRAKFMPYAHALAPDLFLKALHRWEQGDEGWLTDERQIFANRLTRRKFERLAEDAKWTIRYRQTYLVRPALMRMGLPTIPNGFVGRLPLIGEPFTTGCEYLLARA